MSMFQINLHIRSKLNGQHPIGNKTGKAEITLSSGKKLTLYRFRCAPHGGELIDFVDDGFNRQSNTPNVARENMVKALDRMADKENGIPFLYLDEEIDKSGRVANKPVFVLNDKIKKYVAEERERQGKQQLQAAAEAEKLKAQVEEKAVTKKAASTVKKK